MLHISIWASWALFEAAKSTKAPWGDSIAPCPWVTQQLGHVAPTPSLVTKLWYCDWTRKLASKIYKISFFSCYWKGSVSLCCCVSGKRMLVRTWLWRL